MNIGDIGDERKSALDAEARARGLSVAEPVRRIVEDGLQRMRTERERETWIASARGGLAFEAEELERNDPSLARYRSLSGTGPEA